MTDVVFSRICDYQELYWAGHDYFLTEQNHKRFSDLGHLFVNFNWAPKTINKYCYIIIISLKSYTNYLIIDRFSLKEREPRQRSVCLFTVHEGILYIYYIPYILYMYWYIYLTRSSMYSYLLLYMPCIYTIYVYVQYT